MYPRHMYLSGAGARALARSVGQLEGAHGDGTGEHENVSS